MHINHILFILLLSESAYGPNNLYFTILLNYFTTTFFLLLTGSLCTNYIM